MDNPADDEIASLLVSVIADGFNRSLGALREAGAVDCTEMQRAYSGVGSKYYDLVTEQIEYTARVAAPALRDRLAIAPNGGNSSSSNGSDSA